MGGSRTEQAKLTASDAAAGDQFGISVSVDGDTVVVGALRDDDAGSWSGSAYVFALPPPAQCISDFSTAPGINPLMGRQLSILATQVVSQLAAAEQLPAAQAAYVRDAVRRVLANWTNVLIPMFERQGRIPAAVAPQLTGCMQDVAAARP